MTSTEIKKAMQYEKVCQECGKSFTALFGHQKFCESCKKQGYKRSKERAKITLSADTEEMREACLSCTKPRCGGQCERLARVARGKA